jgi:Phage portal protein
MGNPQALTKTPLYKRLTQAVTYGLSGGWFTPEMPLNPQHPETAGRRFDYLAGYNIATRPRRDSGIDFLTLRNFAQYYDILRMLIEKRKDQVVNFEWSVVPSDQDAPAKKGKKQTPEEVKTVKQITDFLKKPGEDLTWNSWLRMIVEDFLVLDANVLWPVYDGMELKSIELIDPATIKIVIDESGRKPKPPFPAYQQVLHGIPTADFLRGEIQYFMSNPATNRVYGLSKVEQALITIQIGLRREISQLQFFTDGNIPAALAGVPDNWNSSQIAAFQDAFDSMLAGDTAARRKIWFVPGDVSKQIKELKSEDAILKGEFDEWVIRVLCFNLGISPTPFVKQVNRATAESAAEEAREEGLGPTLTYIKDMMDVVIKFCMRIDGYEFRWSTEADVDPTSQADIDDKNLRNGSASLDEIRQSRGQEAVGVGPMIYLPTGPVPVSMFRDGTAPNLQPKPAPGEQSPSEDGKPPDKQEQGQQESDGEPNLTKGVRARSSPPFQGHPSGRRFKKRFRV